MDRTYLPLIAHINGERVIVGSAYVEERDREYIISGVLETEYATLLGSDNTRHLSIGSDRELPEIFGNQLLAKGVDPEQVQRILGMDLGDNIIRGEN